MVKVARLNMAWALILMVSCLLISQSDGHRSKKVRDFCLFTSKEYNVGWFKWSMFSYF